MAKKAMRLAGITAKEIQGLLLLRREKAELEKELASLEKHTKEYEDAIVERLMKGKILVSIVVGVEGEYVLEVKTSKRTTTKWAKAFVYYLPKKVSAVQRDKRFSATSTSRCLKIQVCREDKDIKVLKDCTNRIKKCKCALARNLYYRLERSLSMPKRLPKRKKK